MKEMLTSKSTWLLIAMILITAYIGGVQDAQEQEKNHLNTSDYSSNINQTN